MFQIMIDLDVFQREKKCSRYLLYAVLNHTTRPHNLADDDYLISCLGNLIVLKFVDCMRSVFHFHNHSEGTECSLGANLFSAIQNILHRLYTCNLKFHN